MKNFISNLASKLNPRPARSQRGDTMIEVLVTTIIIAIGVLGSATLQVTALKNLASSHNSSVAAFVAEDFGERMRANPVAVLNDDYVHSTAPDTYPDCVAEACSNANLALFDIGSWWLQLSDNLPAATGEVTRNAGTSTFLLTVRWDSNRDGSSGENCPNVTTDDLDCYQIEITI
jgi:type IV pilus assembly protein PilV